MGGGVGWKASWSGESGDQPVRVTGAPPASILPASTNVIESEAYDAEEVDRRIAGRDTGWLDH
jgi:hypothetical protein